MNVAMQQQLAKQEMDMAAYTRKFELDMERMEEMAERSTEDRD
jgi:hypothetical protein